VTVQDEQQRRIHDDGDEIADPPAGRARAAGRRGWRLRGLLPDLGHEPTVDIAHQRTAGTKVTGAAANGHQAAAGQAPRRISPITSRPQAPN